MNKFDTNSNLDALTKKLNGINSDLKKLSLQKILIIASLFLVVFSVFYFVQRQQELRSSSAAPEVVEYLETFSGNPAAPEPFTQLEQDNWDIQVHKRDMHRNPLNYEPMQAQHGTGCQSPNDPTNHSHTITTAEQSVYNCRDHVMTALNASDYGVIYLTPDHIVDFSDGEAIIRVDVSTFNTSGRDWWDIWISPYDQNLALPFGDFGVDLQGPPRNAILIEKNSDNVFCIKEYRNFQNVTPGVFTSGNTCTWWTGYTSFLTPDKSRRDTFEVRISKDRIRFGMPQYNFQWHDYRPTQPLSFDQGVVQLGHHSYTPEKDCWTAPSDGRGCRANSWHWDNVYISKAIPFTMIKADKRYVWTGPYHTLTTDEQRTITFNEPAPANSHLRFSANGNVQISLNGGSFVNAQRPEEQTANAGHAGNFWHPVPEGTRTVAFRFSQRDWEGSPYVAKDFAIWSRTAPGVGGTNPTATTAPAATNTPVPSAPTATPVPPTATPTNIPAATSSPTPVVTAQSALSLSPVSSNVTAGANFSVQVRVNTNGQTVNGVDAQLSYPTNRLEVLSIDDNNSNFEHPAESTASNGTISLAYATSTPKTGNLLVATINFRALSAGTANVNFSANSEVISNISNSNVLNSRTNGTYTIVAPTPIPTNTPVPTSTPTPTPVPQLIGDMNNDGKVDIQDLSYLLSRWRTNDSRADLNRDGTVNIRDVSILLSNWTRR